MFRASLSAGLVRPEELEVHSAFFRNALTASTHSEGDSR